MFSIGVGVLVDDDVVDDLERGEVHAPAGPAARTAGSSPFVMCASRGEAGDQDVGLALGVHQMADVAGMHEVEGAVAHDDLARRAAGAEDRRAAPRAS